MRLHVTEKRMIALYLAELSYDAGRREKPGSEAFALSCLGHLLCERLSL